MYRVMIVDDEDYVRDLLVESLQEAALEVEVVAAAGDGKEALEAAILLDPDIVITDIAMPFMNGLELIKEMQQKGLHGKSVVISGYDEFDYAKKAIALGVKDYLLKPFLPAELYDVISKVIKELDNQKMLQQNMSLLKEQASSRAGLVREKAVKDILEGRLLEESFDGREFGLCLTGNFFIAGIVRLDGGRWKFNSQESVEEFLMLVKEGYLPNDIRMYAVSFDQTQLAAIWCGDGENETIFLRKVKNGMEKIMESLKKYYEIQLLCALGRPCSRISELEQSYKEARAEWRGTLETGNPILFYGEREEKKEEVNNGQIRDFKNQIRIAVRTGQTEEALKQLQGLMKCYASLANKKNDYISISVGELVYDIFNDLDNAGYDREEVEPAQSVLERTSYGSLMDMKEVLEVYIRKCCRVISEYSEETKAGTLVKRVKVLIENHLKNSELDLEWVADQVNFSSSYVRQIFKQQTGEGFSEYLIRKRMEQAGMLLQKTGLKIQEVASECGYDNQRYFASSFKKFYGCTPTEFKKLVEEDHLY